jgi:hypothetical protein
MSIWGLPTTIKSNIVLLFMPITVAELKTRKLIGSRQRVRSNQIQSQHCAILHVHHHCRAKDKEAHWLTSESKIQSDSKPTLCHSSHPSPCRRLIGSSQRARSNQIQNHCCAVLYVHHRRRAKDKEAHWLTSESKIQSDSKPTPCHS